MTCRALIPITLLAVLLPAVPARADWVWPVRGEVITPYRNGDDPYAAGQHRGIDIAAEPGTAVVAAAGGEVRFAGTAGSSGLTVSIRTADGLFDTSYLHLSATAVRKGQRIAAGETVGAVGTTGVRSAERPHLHFGIRDAGSEHAYHDPLAFLPPTPAPPDRPRPAPGTSPTPVPVLPPPEGAAVPPSGTAARPGATARSGATTRSRPTPRAAACAGPTPRAATRSRSAPCARTTPRTRFPPGTGRAQRAAACARPTARPSSAALPVAAPRARFAPCPRSRGAPLAPRSPPGRARRRLGARLPRPARGGRADRPLRARPRRHAQRPSAAHRIRQPPAGRAVTCLRMNTRANPCSTSRSYSVQPSRSYSSMFSVMRSCV